MYKEIPFRHVFPYLNSLEEAINTHRSFPNYEERLKKGILAWDIEWLLRESSRDPYAPP